MKGNSPPASEVEWIRPSIGAEASLSLSALVFFRIQSESVSVLLRLFCRSFSLSRLSVPRNILCTAPWGRGQGPFIISFIFVDKGRLRMEGEKKSDEWNSLFALIHGRGALGLFLSIHLSVGIELVRLWCLCTMEFRCLHISWEDLSYLSLPSHLDLRMTALTSLHIQSLRLSFLKFFEPPFSQYSLHKDYSFFIYEGV